MGWLAIDKDNKIYREETDGRPVQLGNRGGLKLIAQEDFGHTVAVDLLNGVIAIDYENLTIQNGSIELHNPKTVLWVCDETNIVGELFHLIAGEPDAEGWFPQEIKPLKFRPIWFTRWTNGVPTKVIGVQVTLPKVHGRKNVKKMVSIFANGRLGVA